MKKSLRRYILITLAAGAGLGLVYSSQTYVLAIFSRLLIFAIAAIGLNILTGMAGQVSIGHAAFMALGAYTTAFLSQRFGMPFWLNLIPVALIAAMFGYFIGLPALRMKGFYLAIATMAFGVVIEQLIAGQAWLGAHTGMREIVPFFGKEILNYAVNFGFFLVLSVAAFALIDSPMGTKYRMVRDSEVAAKAYGINVSKVKLHAFMVSAVYGGIAGALYAHTVGFIIPSSFGLAISVNLLAAIMIGGLGFVQGSLYGAVLIFGLPYFMSRGFGQWLTLIIGIMLIVFVMFFPKGVAYGLTMLWHRWMQRPLIWARRRFVGGMRSNSKFATVKGKKIHYLESGEGRPVLMIHGNTGSSEWYADVMDIEGRRCIAADLPNCGLSDRIDTGDMDVYADYMLGLMDVLGLKSATVVAHSLGGAVAISMACRYPERVEKLMLVDPCPVKGLVTPEEHYPVIELYKTSRDMMKAALGAMTPGMKDDAKLDRLVDGAFRMNLASFTEHPRALARFNYTGRCGNFKNKVLFVIGRKDTLITESMAKESAAEFPNSEVRVIEGVGHSLMVEAPEEFVSFVKEL
ncbi:MAG TPA: alpha/beta fold hydrolase [Bacillota bacterium]|nr:alpha/beta fold hydrolase [Bacillota bacterium]